jgi:hypothetical protein
MLLALTLFFGCTTTVKPHDVNSTAPSYSGTNQNSGFVAWTTNSAGETTGAIIDDRAKDRLEGLAAVYGKKYIPPFVPQFTFVGTGWFIDAETLARFREMNQWHKNNR